MAKKLKWNLILMSLLYLALGIFLLMVPGTALNVVCYALGGVVLACAAVQLIRYFVVERGVFQSQLTLISGLICLALGVFLLLRSDIVVSILPIVFGLFVIFDAIGRVQNALDLRRCGYDSWKGFLLLPVLSVVLGVVLIVNPFGAMETLVMAIGIILIVEGAINLLSALYTVLAIRRFSKLHPETQSMLESLTGQDLNGDGRRELIVGWRISAEVQTVAVYTVAREPVALMSSGYTRFTIQDLNGDGIPSLLVLRTDADSQPVAEFYGWQDEQMGVAYRCVLSSSMASLNRGSMVSGRVDADTPALFITGVDEQGMAVTDILVFRSELGLVNLALTGSNRGDRHNRDILINSAFLGVEGTAEYLEELIQKKYGSGEE